MSAAVLGPMRLKRADPRPRAPGFAGLAFEQLGTALQRYLLRRVRNSQSAEDLEQEVYLRLLRVPNAELVRCPEAYVYRIASHLIGQAASEARHGTVDFNSEVVDRIAMDLRDDAAAPEEIYEQQGQEERLAKAVSQLPPMQKAVFMLARYQGLSHAEIGKKFGISPHTVKKHMLRAICHCRNALKEKP